MKAILIVDLPDETNINEMKRMMVKGGEGASIPCNILEIKPMPNELDYASDWEDKDIIFRQGWNACLDEITGETE